MSRAAFLDLLASRPWLLADGATGTNYFDMGLTSGDAPELWNFDHPDRVRRLHGQFVAAGADIILTNTFGGNRYRLKLHDAQNRVRDINVAAAQNARAEADAVVRPVIVAGSMGPTGEIFAPVGTLEHHDGVAAFAEQASALAEGGADVLWIETMSAEEELRAAVEGAGEAGLPIVTTMSFDTNGRTMMGITPGLFRRAHRKARRNSSSHRRQLRHRRLRTGGHRSRHYRRTARCRGGCQRQLRHSALRGGPYPL